MNMHRPVNPYPAEPYPSAAAKPAEREWRVGSLSMGITLILIGTAFAVSIWQNTEAYELLLWVAPVVFILLGVELLIYLKTSGKSNTIIRYDWLSVFFVGLLGLGSLVLSLLMSSGVYGELQREINMITRTAYVESGKVEVPKEIKKIVVQSALYVSVEEADTNKLQLIGQIRYRSMEPMSNQNELIHTTIVGSSLYVFVNAPDMNSGVLTSDSISPGLIVTLPKGLEVERRPY
ncbi:hypothetical protein D3P07_18210 [Paenibacillus sp. 1011MAR3C5]|uniref:hypothetical protein n=1 Tax=Paenibacillus sp. 1011MAR3C5 TaxID=1675787 RepID=UPI000E6C3E51|nr:hypothetical protein [Paenibacillus sp. 1011MAR3C5]RJE86024.1 hypothetical protein D3P07_18210 [Paenibacillus sp. 1011MAR3C5]